MSTAGLQAPPYRPASGVRHVTPLRPWRGDVGEWWSLGAPVGPGMAGTLGAVAYGEGCGALSGVGLPLLGGASCDGWLAAPVLRAGTCGPVHWRDNGCWLFGQLDLPDDDDVSALAQRAYEAVFATLRETGRPHLVRLWNYLPRINEESTGLERYRRFNIGRQAAFIAAGADAGEGSPAACALGKAGGPLSIRFLATTRPVLPLENPRQTPAYRYSAAWGPRAPTFSRAVLADAGAGQVALLISGTASIVGEASLHAGDVAAQVRETCTNLRTLVQAAERRGSGRFDLSRMDAIVYLRRADDLTAVRAALAGELGAASPLLQRAVFVQADICRRELLVEIEAHALATGEVAA